MAVHILMFLCLSIVIYASINWRCCRFVITPIDTYTLSEELPPLSKPPLSLGARLAYSSCKIPLYSHSLPLLRALCLSLILPPLSLSLSLCQRVVGHHTTHAAATAAAVMISLYW